MLHISSGELTCWPGFSLKLESELSFLPGNSYHLVGNNGSGKSSFITQILLPLLQKHEANLYRIYVQQLFHIQGFAIKAHAAINKPELKLRSEQDCLIYLLHNLSEAIVRQARPVYLIVDESLYLPVIYDYLKQFGFPHCLIYSHHGANPLPTPDHTIAFKPLSANVSSVYETGL